MAGSRTGGNNFCLFNLCIDETGGVLNVERFYAVCNFFYRSGQLGPATGQVSGRSFLRTGEKAGSIFWAD
jgi:hypothetical protein